MNTFLRLKKVMDAMGISRSTVYLRIRQGLMTPPVKLGERCSAWPSREIEMIIAAQISGKPNGVIKALVNQLVADRGAT